MKKLVLLFLFFMPFIWSQENNISLNGDINLYPYLGTNYSVVSCINLNDNLYLNLDLNMDLPVLIPSTKTNGPEEITTKTKVRVNPQIGLGWEFYESHRFGLMTEVNVGLEYTRAEMKLEHSEYNFSRSYSNSQTVITHELNTVLEWYPFNGDNFNDVGLKFNLSIPFSPVLEIIELVPMRSGINLSYRFL